jgi:hypothetical protein
MLVRKSMLFRVCNAMPGAPFIFPDQKQTHDL